MSLAGKYLRVSHENYENFVKALGVPDEDIQLKKDLTTVSEIEQNGNDFKITVTSGPKVLCNKFTIGKEAEIETMTGDKIKTVFHLDGNKLSVFMNSMEVVTELVDPNTLMTTMTVNNIVYKATNKRV